MPTLLNPHPKDNPMAIKIPLDTVINGVSLNPSETYDVVINPIVNNVNSSITYPLITVGTNQYIKKLQLYTLDAFVLKIYLPLFDNDKFIYIVPCVSNSNYEDGIKDITSESEYNTPFTVPFSGGITRTWAQILEQWIYGVVYGNNPTTPPTKTTLMQKDISFSFKGVDTNRSDATKNINLTLQSLATETGI